MFTKIKIAAKKLRYEIKSLKKRKYGNFFQFRKGFSKVVVGLNGIDKTNYKNYLSDRAYYNGHPWNGFYTGIIDCKLYLPYLLNSYKEYLPKTYFFKDKEGFLPIHDGKSISSFNLKTRYNSKEIVEFLKSNKETVFKHTHYSAGKGFHLISFVNGKFFLDNSVKEEEEILSFLDSLDKYILQEKIVQAKYSSDIYSGSVNTIRLICAWNPQKESFEIIQSIHRFGSHGSLVDNLGTGKGVVLHIDTQTGTLSDSGGITENKKLQYLKNTLIKHPDTGKVLTGLIIPNFEFIRDKILEISNSISFLKYIGWDIAITSDGFKIIETNSLSSFELLNQKNGFLEEEWLKNLFANK